MRDNEDIIILLADKGGATVIMDKDDYNSKMMNMLDDTDVYKKLKCDPTSSLKGK